MDKIIRKAIRTFLIKDNKIVVIKYKEHDRGYYDIPGGKIEDKETPEEASIREFKEETGITITRQHYIGNATIKYPERIFEFSIFIVDDYYGDPLEFEENCSLWIDLSELFKESKLFPSIELIKYLKANMKVEMECDINHNIINMVIASNSKKKIVFDIDNTLLFLSDKWKEKYQEYIDKYGWNITPEDFYKAIGSIEKNFNNIIITMDFFIEYMNERLRIDLTKEKVYDFFDIYAEIPLRDTRETYEVLKYLSQKYDLIAFSNWFSESQKIRLRKYNLEGFFTKIYGCDNLPIKPSREAILQIIKDDDINNFIFIGDNIDCDLDLPNSMGMDTIFYNIKNVKQDKYKEIVNIKDLEKIL